MKTINDIIAAAGLSDGSRNALLYRIKHKYFIEPITDNYRKEFSEEDFKIIVAAELKRKKNDNYGNFRRKKRAAYHVNKEYHCYSRLTDYGGIN